MQRSAQEKENTLGYLYGAGGYVWWGLAPFYFKAVIHVAPIEVLLHRIVWTFVLLVGIVTVQRNWAEVALALGDRKTLAKEVLCGLLIASNWLIYIDAVTRGDLMQASLGYFINPLLIVALGFVFLKERLRTLQYLSLSLAAVGVAYYLFALGQAPWVALSLAGTFGVYGLIRKTAPVNAVPGLLIDTMVLTPVALVWLGREVALGRSAFLHGPGMDNALLLCAGVVTAVPLLLFAGGARRIPYAMMGFLQYIAPTLQFLIAVFAFHEALNRDKFISFLFVWVGLFVFAADAAVRLKRKKQSID